MPGRAAHKRAVATSSDVQLQSDAERFVEALQAEDLEHVDAVDKIGLQQQYKECTDKVHTFGPLLCMHRIAVQKG